MPERKGRGNRSGIDWADPAARKARMRENTRTWKKRGGKKDKPPIELDGVEYKSIRAAADALNVTYAAIWLRLHPEVRRRAKTSARRRSGAFPKGLAARRWVRLGKDDMTLALRLLPHFPTCDSVAALCAYALRKLAETTDD